MQPSTIDIYLDGSGEHFVIATATSGFNAKWVSQAEQHERFVSAPHIVNVCVWNGRLTRAECQAFVIAWLGAQFTSIDLNK